MRIMNISSPDSCKTNCPRDGAHVMPKFVEAVVEHQLGLLDDPARLRWCRSAAAGHWRTHFEIV